MRTAVLEKVSGKCDKNQSQMGSDVKLTIVLLQTAAAYIQQLVYMKESETDVTTADIFYIFALSC